jgi:hypothetical protein
LTGALSRVFRVFLLLLLPGLALAQPASGSADAVTRAQAALGEARAAAKASPSKGSELAMESALAAYNQAVAARVGELVTRMNALSVGRPSTAPVDDLRSVPEPLSGAALAEYRALDAELKSLTPGPFSPAPVVLTETEPNDTAGTANVLAFAGPAAVIGGAISPAGDADYFSFTAPAGSKAWISVDTGGTQNSGANSRDSVVALLEADGTTVIEADDDDGTGNGCDGTTESDLASAIAGRTLTAGGTYYVRVSAFGGADVISPYKLFVLVTLAPAASEVEPNKDSATANPIVSPADAVGVRRGVISSAIDEDVYSVYAAAGNILMIAADGDPERDGGTDIAVDLLDTDGTSVLITADSSTSTLGNAEAFCYSIGVSGIYYVRIRQAGTLGTGTYSLAVASTRSESSCLTLHSTLGSDSPDYPAVHGVQTGRLFRDGIPSSCEAPKACPGLFDAAGARTYDAYTFANTTGGVACVTVDMDGESCTGTSYLFGVAYLNSFDPNNLCANYLADSGSSPSPGQPFSFEVPAGQSAVIVIHEVNPGAGCGGYGLSVSGICGGAGQALHVDAHSGPGTNSNLNGIFEPGETVQIAPVWKNVFSAFVENFDLVGAPSSPPGWVAANALGAAPLWVTSAASFDTPPNGAFVNDPNTVSDKRLDSPTIAVPLGASQLRFRNSYFLESTFDGGVLEISIGGAPFQDILAAGGSFASGGYSGTISMNFMSPIAGRMAWTGNSNGFITTVVNLPPAAAGQGVVLRFRMASDTSVSGTGWTVDTISLVGPGTTALAGTGSNFTGPGGPSYTFNDVAADYGTVPAGGMADCYGATADCFAVTVAGARPALHWDTTFLETLSTGLAKTWMVHVGQSFTDVSTGLAFYPFIENIFHNGITGGCGGTGYCPNNSVTRAQMAVFLLKAKHGSGYIPPPCTGVFPDVTCPSLFADWIEQLAAEGITGGCGGGNYCPNNAVTRAQMAVFLLKALHSSAYLPPVCSGVFPDVTCPSTFADWIEELAAEGITGGCGGGNYCPGNPNTRGQMAVFLVKTFGLLLYGP